MNGFINILKPPGMTSAAVVATLRRLTGGEKAGHAGTLDPEAAGVLPVMVGRAARLFDYLVDKEKEYVAEVAFGTATDTQDATGRIVAQGTSYPTRAQVEAALLAGVRPFPADTPALVADSRPCLAPGDPAATGGRLCGAGLLDAVLGGVEVAAHLASAAVDVASFAVELPAIDGLDGLPDLGDLGSFVDLGGAADGIGAFFGGLGEFLGGFDF